MDNQYRAGILAAIAAVERIAETQRRIAVEAAECGRGLIADMHEYGHLVLTEAAMALVGMLDE